MISIYSEERKDPLLEGLLLVGPLEVFYAEKGVHSDRYGGAASAGKGGSGEFAGGNSQPQPCLPNAHSFLVSPSLNARRLRWGCGDSAAFTTGTWVRSCYPPPQPQGIRESFKLSWEPSTVRIFSILWS